MSSHRLVPADVCDINGLLPKDAAIDYDAIHAIYKDGVNSVKSDGSVRTIGGFAVGEGKKHGVDTYFGTATPLHDFVISAIEGTGEFEGEADLVRRQGIQKGIMNQIMVAWTVHEINAALAKGADGNYDPASGAPHNWDEGWAFYAGSEPGCSAFATADKRGKDFGTLNDSGESVANANIRAAFNSGRDALVAGDQAGAQAAADVIVKNLTVTYAQATMKYAKSVDSDIADGDMDTARVHQAEGYAFWRVLAPMLAGTDVDVAAINGVYQLSNQPAAGSHDIVVAALTPALLSVGVTANDTGYFGSDDGYAYASDVSSHRLVPADVCDINGLLPKDAAIDYDAIHAIYKDGVNSVKSDGSVRTIGGFAVGEGKKHGVDTYFGTATPLHDFVISAIEGTGEFEGEADLVRRQGIQKGIMNQIMVAWTVHEINAALAKGADGNYDPASGAPHNWDEGWAFYAGSEPGCSAFATADKRGKDFGTLNDSGESVANANIRAAFNSGRDALVAGDQAGAQAAADVIVKNLTVTYAQATMKYAKSVDSDIADGDMDTARVHQAEGYAFWRVLAPMLAGTDVDVAAINGVYQLSNQPAAGSHDIVVAALTPALTSLGITESDLGSY